MNVKNPNIIIREAIFDDARRLSQLGADVFLRSYQHPYEPGDMDIYLKANFSEEKTLKELQKKTAHYFVAQAGAIVGFVKVNTHRWTWRFKGRLTFEVERLYIQKDMEGKNIGRRLMATALGAARQRGYRIIWLSVWENNKKAIAFHQRFGFVPVGDGIFSLGTSERKYLIMQKK